MRRLSTILAAAGLTMAVAACGGDGPTGSNSGDELTQTEIQALFNELGVAMASLGLGEPPTAGPSASAGSVPFEVDFNQSAACTEAGTISLRGSVNGNFDDETNTGDMSVDLFLDFNACQVSSETTMFTVDGDPEIQFMADMAFTPTTVSIDGSQQGGFRFTTADGRTGSCAIDLTFSSSVNSETSEVSQSVSGTVCGQSAAVFEPVAL